MRNLKLLAAFSLIIPLLLSGCVFLAVGAVGAVGGYAITRDTIQGDYDARYSQAWRATLDVCGIMGTVTAKEMSKGVVEAAINGAKVHVEITQLTHEAIRIKVKARKGIFPRLATAQDVFVKIVQQFIK